ncbi:MAG: hypothetical protein AB7H80_06715, partial [Candidatus Kapaibacterium sp.]
WGASGGGQGNRLGINSDWSTIGGGRNNRVRKEVFGGAISGGEDHVIDSAATYAAIGGGFRDTISAGSQMATIGGGLANKIGMDVLAGTIGGGQNNVVDSAASSATIAGGSTNVLGKDADFGTIGGGLQNGVRPLAEGSTVAGGRSHLIDTAAIYGTIAGGFDHTVGSHALYSTIGGGNVNLIDSGSTLGVIAGGGSNSIAKVIGGGTVGGGFQNAVAGESATVAGGRGDTAAGAYSAIPGGRGLRLNGNRSFGFHGNNSAGTLPMSVTASDVAVFGNTDLWLANNDNAASELRFYEAYSTAGAFPNTANYTALKAGTQAGDITYTLPATNGAANQVLRIASTPAPTATTATLEWGTTSAISVVGGFAFVRKSAAESVVSSTTLQNDDHLTTALSTNSTYEVQGLLYVTSTDNNHNIQLAFTVPTGSTMRISYSGQRATTNTQDEGDILTTSGTAATAVNVQVGQTTVITIRGLVRTAGTAGNITLQWADDNAGGAETVTVGIDSYLRVTRVE